MTTNSTYGPFLRTACPVELAPVTVTDECSVHQFTVLVEITKNSPYLFVVVRF